MYDSRNKCKTAACSLSENILCEGVNETFVFAWTAVLMTVGLTFISSKNERDLKLTKRSEVDLSW